MEGFNLYGGESLRDAAPGGLGGLGGFTDPPAAPQPTDPSSRFDTYFAEASKETGIPVAILKAQAQQESSFNPGAVGRAGEVGLFQVKPTTAAQPGYGVEPIDPAKLTDPGENIRFGARYLAGRAKQAGVQNWSDPQQVATALTAYNGGGDPNYAQNVFRYLKPPGGPDAPASGPVDMYGNSLGQRGAQQEAAAPAAQAPTPFWKAKTQPADEWASNLQRVATGGAATRPDSFTGMDGKFGQSLAGMIQAAPPEIQKQLQINSGYRSAETQARLWEQALQKYGSPEAARKWVAPPGGSKHGDGIAADLKFLSPDAKQWVHANAERFGMHFPLSNEPWHIEPIGSRDGSYQVAGRAQPQGQPQQAAPINPNITAAAERGRGPAADRIGRGMANDEGPAGRQKAMPQMAPDLSNANDAGVRDFILRQAGMAPDQAGQRAGGLGGLGGFAIPGTGQVVPAGSAPVSAPGSAPQGVSQEAGPSVESLIPQPSLNPFAFGAAARENEKVMANWRGQVFTAKQFMAQGMSAEQAVGALNAKEIGQNIALGTLQQQRAQREQAAVRSQLDGPQGQQQVQPQGGPQQQPAVQPGPMPVQAQGGQPAPVTGGQGSQPAPTAASQPGVASAGQPAPMGKINSPNLTVNEYFANRTKAVDELIRLYKIQPTTATEPMLKSRAEALKLEVSKWDKKIEDLNPTSATKEYYVAMKQRQEAGQPLVAFENYDPEQGKKDAVAGRGAQTEEVTGLRKEVQGLPSYKNLAAAAPIYRSMMETAGRDDRASDINMIYGLAKVMDPTSVVRGEEMTMAKAIATLPEQLSQTIQSQLTSTGQLSPKVRAGIMREANSRLTAHNQLFQQDATQYRKIATDRKMDVSHVLPDFGEFKPYEPAKVEKPGSTGATGTATPAQVRDVPSQYVRPDGSSPPMPAAAAPVKAFTKADRDKLSAGTLYTDANGDTRRKGGN